MFRLARRTPWLLNRSFATAAQDIGTIDRKGLIQAFKAKNTIVIDVRQPEEIQETGSLSPNTENIPLPVLLSGGFQFDAVKWEEEFGFEKPAVSDRIIFSCLAGIRSQHACKAAIDHGYKNVVNYVGGAQDYFQLK